MVPMEECCAAGVSERGYAMAVPSKAGHVGRLSIQKVRRMAVAEIRLVVSESLFSNVQLHSGMIVLFIYLIDKYK